MKKKDSGFTIIELIMVVSIIAILVGVAYLNFTEARAKSRDMVRQTTLQEMQIALALYKAQYGVYPEQGCGGTTGWTGPGPHSASWGNNTDCPEYIVGLAPDFISALPLDPKEEFDDNKGYLYRVNATRSAYKLLAHNVAEVDLVTSYDHPLARCPGELNTTTCPVSPDTNTYAVYSAGAEDW